MHIWDWLLAIDSALRMIDLSIFFNTTKLIMSGITCKFALAFLTILAASAVRADSINWLTDSTTGYHLQITGSSVDGQSSIPQSIDSPSGLWNFYGGDFAIDPTYSPGVAHLLGNEIAINLLAVRNGAFIFSSYGPIEWFFPTKARREALPWRCL